MDPYIILGIDKKASEDDIKKAYKKLALKNHPDKGGDAAEFQKISEAYDILSDKTKKSHYDNPRAGNPFKSGAPRHGGQMDNIFASMFTFPVGGTSHSMFSTTTTSKSNVTPDLKHQVMMSLDDMYKGKKCKLAISRSVQCVACEGIGGNGKREEVCIGCNGRGVRVIHTGSSMRRSPCIQCHGSGCRIIFDTACKACNTKCVTKERVVVEAPFAPGTTTGTKVVIKGMSDFSEGKKTGDVVITAKMKDHPFYKRSGKVLRCIVEINLTDSLCGFKKTIKHLDGREILLESENITNNGHKVRIPKEGIPRGHGLLEVEFKVSTPITLSQDVKDQIKSILNNDK